MIFLAPVIVKYMERTLIQRNLFMANIFCQYLSPSLYRLSALVVLIYNPQGLNVKIKAERHDNLLLGPENSSSLNKS